MPHFRVFIFFYTLHEEALIQEDLFCICLEEASKMICLSYEQDFIQS